MKVFEALSGRRSIRKFSERVIEEEKVERLVDALIWAPSAGNLQMRKFFFVKDEKVKRAISSAALNQMFIAEAPLVVVGCTNSRIVKRYGDRGVHLYTIQDVACSIMCMMLAAYEMGLGSVWVGAFYESPLADALDLPDSLRPVTIVPVGYPEESPSAPTRVDRDEAIVFM